MGSRSADTRPKMISSRLMTNAKTGRRGDFGGLWLVKLLDAGPVAHLLRTFDDHALTILEPCDNFHFSGTPAPDSHPTFARNAVRHYIHIHLALLRNERLLRNQHGGNRLRAQLHRHEHAMP
jgi:hypothetical protein